MVWMVLIRAMFQSYVSCLMLMNSCYNCIHIFYAILFVFASVLTSNIVGINILNTTTCAPKFSFIGADRGNGVAYTCAIFYLLRLCKRNIMKAVSFICGCGVAKGVLFREVNFYNLFFCLAVFHFTEK